MIIISNQIKRKTGKGKTNQKLSGTMGIFPVED
jgi:hypothetical protein